jgi:myo-inositol-1(or 4)-monophosphatase
LGAQHPALGHRGGLLLIQEAGGMVTTADGEGDPRQAGSVCAANLDLHPVILERLRAAA